MDQSELSEAKMAFEGFRDAIDYFKPKFQYDMPDTLPTLKKIDKYLKLICEKIVLLENSQEFKLKQAEIDKFQREFAIINGKLKT